MSGTKTIKELLTVARKSVCTGEDKNLLKSHQILNENEEFQNHIIELLKENERKIPNSIVFVKADKTLSFDPPVPSTEKPESSEGEEGKSENTSEEFEFSAGKVKELIEGKSLALDQEKIKSVLENHMKNLPKTSETYKAGDVIIKSFKGVSSSISSLLSAGTKVLDSILYMAYKESAEHNFIFKITELSPPKINGKELTNNIEVGNKAIKAAFCLVFNQGGLPSKTKDEKSLSKFIKETIFRNPDLKSNTLVELLSSADPSFFPSEVFLQTSLSHLPSEVASRCKMSIAGNKAIRYALLAQKFEKRELKKPSEGSVEATVAYMTELEKVVKAKKIVETLCSLGSNFEAQRRMHPLSPLRPSRKNFTLQLTCAIIYSLSEGGRNSLRNSIDGNKIEAFKRDGNFYGEKNHLNEIAFPVLTNVEADFSELSVEAVKTAYGITG